MDAPCVAEKSDHQFGCAKHEGEPAESSLQEIDAFLTRPFPFRRFLLQAGDLLRSQRQPVLEHFRDFHVDFGLEPLNPKGFKSALVDAMVMLSLHDMGEVASCGKCKDRGAKRNGWRRTKEVFRSTIEAARS